MSTVVVFGGTGFLGRQLVHGLAAEGRHLCVSRCGMPTVREAPYPQQT